MANTYTWTIEAMKCCPERDGQTNVVTSVGWMLSATDGAGHGAMKSGSQEVPLHDPFVPYASLTEAQVIQWVQDALGAEVIAAMKATLDAVIAEQVNPTVIVPALPWA
jgi:hypothetical protein